MTDAVEAAVANPASNPDLKWYVFHAYSVME